MTNLKRLAKACGDDTDDWMGKTVILYVDPDIEFGGNVVGGLRLKAARKAAPGLPGQKSDVEVNRKLRDAIPNSDIPFN